MLLSIQRGCDGILTPNAPCEARLELTVTVPDPVDSERSAAFVATWEQAAAQLGWRRSSGLGETLLIESAINRKYQMQAVIPSAKTWVTCPACSAAMHLVCAVCAADGRMACPCGLLDVQIGRAE